MSNVTTKVSVSPSQQGEQAPETNLINHTSSSQDKLKAQWNPILGVFLVVVIFFGSQIISEIFLSYYRYPKHWDTQQILNWLNNSINARFFLTLIAEFLVVLAVYWFVRSYKDGLRIIGLRRPRWTDPFYGFAAVPVYLIIYLVAVFMLTHLIPGLNVNEKQQLGFNNASGVEQLTLTFISLVILPPIAEEILFRGLLYSSLKKNLPTIVAAIGTSILFAIGHLPEGGSAGPLYIAAIDTFILSLILIYLREKTGGLWASMTLHALKNTIAFVALYAAVIR
jgi:membrane protease YdiL (CAAX protease family)